MSAPKHMAVLSTYGPLPEEERFRIRPAAIAYVLAVAALCVAKHFLVCDLPILVRYYPTDDELMVQMADAILRGNWVGEYSPINLMKGCFFPLVLAAAHMTGLSWLGILDALNSLACIFFCFEMRPLVRNRILRFVLFVVLMLNPLTMAANTFQRVYRNSITVMQVLFLFGAILGAYLILVDADRIGSRGPNRDDWAVDDTLSDPSDNWVATVRFAALCTIAGLTLAGIWNTREDSMWVLPFVVCAIATMLVVSAIRWVRGRTSTGTSIARLVALVIPLALLLGGNALATHLNEQAYGAAVRIEVDDGAFARAMRTIYSVVPEVDDEHVSVPAETLERLYEVSPTLASIRPALEEWIAHYDRNDRDKNDGNAEDGWFFWALRHGAFDTGLAITLQESEYFYTRLADEIEAALDDPASGLERRPTMPSALMSPWRDEYFESFPRMLRHAVKILVTFQDVSASLEPHASSREDTAAFFEYMTHDRAADARTASDAGMRIRVDIINAIDFVYADANPVFAIVGPVTLVACIALSAIRGRMSDCVPVLLAALGCALSALVIVIGCVYSDISAFGAVKYFYLVGAYPLMLVAEWLPTLHFLDSLLGGAR